MPYRSNTVPRDVWQLPPDEVHVWVARLDEIARRAASLKETLSEEESKIAGRFYFEQDRIRYVTALGVLRSILGFYLCTDPKQIEFGREKRNKPVLSGKFAPDRIQFNMSRSKELALYAFARDRSLGVDIEKMESIPEMDRIVNRFFTPREIQDYNGLPATARLEAFFRCWARKEAFLKATGDGLYRPLNSFSVSLLPEEQSHVTDADGTKHIAPRILLHDLHVEKGFAAAVAVEGFDGLAAPGQQDSRLDDTLSRMSFGGASAATDGPHSSAGHPVISTRILRNKIKNALSG
jgi:4'-phosphopantetheinyl transferase